jgi:hypothetical protein
MSRKVYEYICERIGQTSITPANIRMIEEYVRSINASKIRNEKGFISPPFTSSWDCSEGFPKLGNGCTAVTASEKMR